MKVFLSWSGKRSHEVAGILKDWLQRVIQAVEPFFTPDMDKGVKWSNEIDEALEGTRFGIVCLTPDNLDSNWIHYETGALSKTKDAYIWTFLHGLSKSAVPQPLGRFQHTEFEREDIFKLLQSINKRLGDTGGNALSETLLAEIFDENWAKLEHKLKEAESLAVKSVDKVRDEKDVLNEILETVREQQRQMNNFEIALGNLSSSAPSVKKVLPKVSIEDLKLNLVNQIILRYVHYIPEEVIEEFKFLLKTIDKDAQIETRTDLIDSSINIFIVEILLSRKISKKTTLNFVEVLIQKTGIEPDSYQIKSVKSDDDIPF